MGRSSLWAQPIRKFCFAFRRENSRSCESIFGSKRTVIVIRRLFTIYGFAVFGVGCHKGSVSRDSKLLAPGSIIRSSPLDTKMGKSTKGAVPPAARGVAARAVRGKASDQSSGVI